jgi:hypothetical protein
MGKFFKFNRKIKIIFIIALAGVFFIISAGCGGNNKKGPNLNDDEFCPASSLVLSEADAKLLNENIKITVYFPDQEFKTLLPENRYMKIFEAKKSPANIATAIVDELLKGPAENSKGKRCIPEGTKILEPVKISGTTAIVNLSKEFVEKNTGDKRSIEMSIYSIVNSITEIKELDMVKILIDGKEQKDIKGVVSMNLAFKRNKSLIQIETVEPEKKAGGETTEEEEILE